MNKLQTLTNLNDKYIPDSQSNTLKSQLFPFRVVCKNCNKTIFYSGETDDITYVLCDRCSQLQ